MEVIDDCIQSVYAQIGNIEIEIIVHDDASSDDSSPYIREHYPKVTVIESKVNVGFCIANNRMVAAANGKYLLLLNNDATLYKDALQSLLAEANQLGHPAILTLPQYDATSGGLIDRGCLLDPFFNPIPNLDSQRCDVAMVIGACLWIPKDLWAELNGFPEWFGSIAEDMYLCCKARLAGYSVRVINLSGYRHLVGSSFGGGKVKEGRLFSTRRRRTLSERNKTFVMLLCTPIPLLLIVLPLHLMLIHLEGIILSAIGRDTVVWRQVYAPIIPSIWSTKARIRNERREIQAMRKVGLSEWLGTFRWYPWKLVLLIKHGLPTFNN
jgi:GT2 family glycosyltransferase